MVLGLAVAIVAAGAGTAWAMRGTSGPAYRLATVTRANVSQTVDADGTLAARSTAVLSFLAAGTVDAVDVAVGDPVRAGQAVATIDATDLQAAVIGAQSTLAKAQQKLADDEAAQAAGTTVSATQRTTASGTSGATAGTGTTGTGTNGTGTDSAGYVRISSPPTRPASTGSSLTRAQQAVVAAQHALDDAITAQDRAVRTLVRQCAAADDSTPTTSRATAGTGGVVSGAAGAQAVVVTLRDAGGDVATTSSANPQRVGAGGTYSFAGLTAGNSYTVAIVRSAVLNTADCTAAVTAVSSGQRALDSTHAALGRALDALNRAVASSATGTGASTGSGSRSSASSGTTGSSNRSSTGTGTGTGSRSSASGGTGANAGSANTGSGSNTGTGSGTGNATGIAVTAELIAADTKSVDAARTALAVAEADRANATLSSPITGKVAAVGLARGDTVSAHSSANTITVVGTGALSTELSIGLSDIDLIKVGQHARVAVDGHSDALPGTVTYVGQTNSAGSSGGSATYPVTVQLARTSSTLYDGMGASVAIDVGTASGVLTVPISAVHTTGRRHVVTVDAGGRMTPTLVTLGVVGADLVQVKTGLRAGQRVVLADLSAAVPTSTDTLRRNRTGSGALTGLTGSGQGGPPCRRGARAGADLAPPCVISTQRPAGRALSVRLKEVARAFHRRSAPAPAAPAAVTAPTTADAITHHHYSEPAKAVPTG